MGSVGSALTAGDQLLKELNGGPHVKDTSDRGATMGRLKRCSYTHDALIDLIIEQPELDQNQLASHFGYTPGWISNILAADAFQARLALRREQVIDPDIKASIEERFRALAIQSLAVLQRKLTQPAVSDTVALRCAELGAKALGVGGHAVPPAPPEDRLQRLAERLVALGAQQPHPAPQPQEKSIEGEVLSVTSRPA